MSFLTKSSHYDEEETKHKAKNPRLNLILLSEKKKWN